MDINITNAVKAFTALGLKPKVEGETFIISDKSGIVATLDSAKLASVGQALSMISASQSPAGGLKSGAARFGSAKDFGLKSAESFARGFKALAGIIGQGPAAAIAGASLKDSVVKFVPEATTGHLKAE